MKRTDLKGYTRAGDSLLREQESRHSFKVCLDETGAFYKHSALQIAKENQATLKEWCTLGADSRLVQIQIPSRLPEALNNADSSMERAFYQYLKALHHLRENAELLGKYVHQLDDVRIYFMGYFNQVILLQPWADTSPIKDLFRSFTPSVGNLPEVLPFIQSAHQMFKDFRDCGLSVFDVSATNIHYWPTQRESIRLCLVDIESLTPLSDVHVQRSIVTPKAFRQLKKRAQRSDGANPRIIAEAWTSAAPSVQRPEFWDLDLFHFLMWDIRYGILWPVDTTANPSEWKESVESKIVLERSTEDVVEYVQRVERIFGQPDASTAAPVSTSSSQEIPPQIAKEASPPKSSSPIVEPEPTPLQAPPAEKTKVVSTFATGQTVPKQIGGYKIMEEMDKLLLGRLFRARSIHLEKSETDVAVLWLSPKVATDEYRDWFVAKSQKSSPKHPHLREMYDVVTSQSKIALVMEYVEGPSLEEYIPTGGMSFDQAVALLTPLGDALDALHKEGVKYSTFYPGNIVVQPDGTPKLEALAISQRIFLTNVKRYVAPEMIKGEKITTSADRYSFGLVTYQILSGTLPWPADSTEEEIYEIKSMRSYIPLTQVSPEHSLAVSDVILDHLCAASGDRHKDCKSFLQALTAAMSNVYLSESPEETDSLEPTIVESSTVEHTDPHVQAPEVLPAEDLSIFEQTLEAEAAAVAKPQSQVPEPSATNEVVIQQPRWATPPERTPTMSKLDYIAGTSSSKSKSAPHLNVLFWGRKKGSSVSPEAIAKVFLWGSFLLLVFLLLPGFSSQNNKYTSWKQKFASKTTDFLLPEKVTDCVGNEDSVRFKWVKSGLFKKDLVGIVKVGNLGGPLTLKVPETGRLDDTHTVEVRILDHPVFSEPTYVTIGARKPETIDIPFDLIAKEGSSGEIKLLLRVLNSEQKRPKGLCKEGCRTSIEITGSSFSGLRNDFISKWDKAQRSGLRYTKDSSAPSLTTPSGECIGAEWGSLYDLANKAIAQERTFVRNLWRNGYSSYANPHPLEDCQAQLKEQLSEDFSVNRSLTLNTDVQNAVDFMKGLNQSPSERSCDSQVPIKEASPADPCSDLRVLDPTKAFFFGFQIAETQQSWVRQVQHLPQMQCYGNPKAATEKVQQRMDVLKTMDKSFLAGDLCLGGKYDNFILSSPRADKSVLRSGKTKQKKIFDLDEYKEYAGQKNVDVFCTNSAQSSSLDVAALKDRFSLACFQENTQGCVNHMQAWLKALEHSRSDKQLFLDRVKSTAMCAHISAEKINAISSLADYKKYTFDGGLDLIFSELYAGGLHCQSSSLYLEDVHNLLKQRYQALLQIELKRKGVEKTVATVQSTFGTLSEDVYPAAFVISEKTHLSWENRCSPDQCAAYNSFYEQYADQYDGVIQWHKDRCEYNEATADPPYLGNGSIKAKDIGYAPPPHEGWKKLTVRCHNGSTIPITVMATQKSGGTFIIASKGKIKWGKSNTIGGNAKFVRTDRDIGKHYKGSFSISSGSNYTFYIKGNSSGVFYYKTVY